MYTLIKSEFICESYLKQIKKTKYLIAFSRFRAGSHTLEIERGRYSNPKTPRDQRLCFVCGYIEDELHFLITCKLYENERLDLFNKIININPSFNDLSPKEKFVFMMTCDIPSILTWVAQFIHNSMLKRAECHLTHKYVDIS